MSTEYEKDPAKRIAFWFYPAIQFGGVMALHDIYVRSQCKTALQAMQRIGYYVLPMGGVGFTLPAMVLVSEGLRGKRDPINYFVGATSCMPILKQWWKLPPYMVRNGVFVISIVVAIFSICEANNGMPDLNSEPIRSPRLLVYDE